MTMSEVGLSKLKSLTDLHESGGPKDEVGHMGPAARRRWIVAASVHLADGNFERVA